MKKIAIVLILFSICLSASALGQIGTEDEIKDRRLYKKIEKLQRIAPKSVQMQKSASQQAFLSRYTGQYYYGETWGWEDVFRSEFSYENGRKVEETGQAYYEGSGWISNYKESFAYSNNLLTEITSQYWDVDLNEWENMWQEQLSYSSINGTQYLTELTEARWIDGEWVADSKVEIDFTDGTFNSYTFFEWNIDIGEWELYGRSILSEEGNDLYIIEEYWNGDEWIADYRTIYSNISKDHFYALIMNELYELNYVGSWMYYTLNMNMPEFTEQSWDGENWIDDWRFRIVTPAAKTTVSSQLQYNFEYYSISSGWITEEVYEYSFDSSGLLEAAIEYLRDYEEGIVSKTEEEEYLYDTDSLLERINRTDFYDGMPDLTARIMLEWNVSTSIVDNSQRPLGYQLGNAYPNPFNPATIIPFKMEAGGHVNIRVYDMLGRQVALLVNEVVPAGDRTVRFNAAGLSSGMYLVRFETAGVQQIRNITLLK